MLDAFYGSLCGTSEFVHGISDRGFAKARSRLHMPALTWLNDWLLQRVDSMVWVLRWHGLRVVLGDASALMPATRAMLAEALECLGRATCSVLDRGYPAAWLIQLLNERGIHFVNRCDSSSSFSAVRDFMRGQQSEKVVLLNAPSARDASDWGCARQAPAVRLVRHTAPDGCTRLLATNIGADLAAAAELAELCHRRWRIAEAFNRLKHRMKLESVSGLSQHALIIDVAAKILADNLASLLCTAAAAAAPRVASRCNRACAAQVCARMLAPVLLCIGDVAALVSDAIALMGRVQQRFVPGRSRPRPAHHPKPHPSQAYKG